MSCLVVLDAGPLGLLTSPPGVQSKACSKWAADLLSVGNRIVVPEIADYEVRRELLRIGSKNGIINLNQLGVQLEYHGLAKSDSCSRFLESPSRRRRNWLPGMSIAFSR